MAIYQSAADLVGKTPIVELKRIEKKEGLKARIAVKLEKNNPAGSAMAFGTISSRAGRYGSSWRLRLRLISRLPSFSALSYILG